MCQLLLANIGKPALNRMFTTLQLMESSTGNTDGTGIMSVDLDGPRIWKTYLAAKNIENLGNSVKDLIINNKPVIGHVRSASKGIAVSNDNAHPFVGARFTLAHNGKLYRKEEAVAYSNFSDDTSLGSDSKMFLEELEIDALAHPDMPFVDLLNLTMSKFKGKFAFMIYDSLNLKYYVVRGNTADLHRANIYSVEEGERKLLGFVVNTKKISLQDGLAETLQLGQLVTGTVLVADPITELAKETVYEVQGKDLIVIGTIKENAVTYASNNSAYFATPAKPKSDGVAFNSAIGFWNDAQKISQFMMKHFLAVEDIDKLFQIFIGKGMADIDHSDMTVFIEEIMPIISAPKKIRKRLDNVIHKGRIYPLTYMEVKKLQFPWMLSDHSAIEAMIARVSKPL